MVKTSILFKDIHLELFIKVPELFSLFPGLSCHLSPHLALLLYLLYPGLQKQFRLIQFSGLPGRSNELRHGLHIEI